MRSQQRQLAITVLSAFIMLNTAGCGSAPTVAVDDYAVPANVQATCAKLVAELPGEVATQGRRVVEPTTNHSEKYAAAWGSPVITVRCGQSTPTGLTAPDGNITVNGITWLPQQLSHGYRFFSQNLSAPVSVTVPSEYSPETNSLADLSKALTPYITQ